ncbi:MAG: 4-hydroxy-tetrahydrodipicolinate reductase [Oscillospiraceae bacterium]|nr:4-hydroxy-tetrahydrodipicolinate reductase [Oscillospiraceae bacterium]
MLKIILVGCNGFTGKAVSAIVADEPDVSIVAGVDLDTTELCGFPVYKNVSEFGGEADVVLDFSSPAALECLIAFSLDKRLPLILCATGYSPEQLAAIEKAAKRIPLFRSGNMSIGINLLSDLVRRACSVLAEGFDVEIVERHHRRKLDAPSGTAMMLADAASDALPYNPEYVFERRGSRQPRAKHEIGISAVRGGTIVGEHDVIFAGQHELIELKHTAFSREVFAIGAVKAAKFMTGIGKPGMYDMSDVLAQVVV